MSNGQGTPSRRASKGHPAAKGVSREKSTGPPWTFIGAPAPWSSEEDESQYYRGASAFTTGGQHAPDDRTPVKAPSWLHDYSWLDKLDLPPSRKRTAVEKCSSSLVLTKEEISRIVHAKEVERARTNKRSISTWKTLPSAASKGPQKDTLISSGDRTIKKIRPRQQRATLRTNQRVNHHAEIKRISYPKLCKPCGKRFQSARDWDAHKITSKHLRNTSPPVPTCDVCNKRFPSHQHSAAHFKSREHYKQLARKHRAERNRANTENYKRTNSLDYLSRSVREGLGKVERGIRVLGIWLPFIG